LAAFFYTILPFPPVRPFYSWKPITLKEGAILRALAILAILLHNYLHWVSDSPGENEFTFRPERWNAFLQGIQHTPLDGIRWLAAYFGHYGVQVFFFLSGYGLAVKYTASASLGLQPQLSWLAFQKKRWRSLFPAIIAATLGYLAYESLRLGWHHVLTTEGVNLLRQIIGISNFLPDNVYHPIGPWWFISVILQFYLIAPFILRLTRCTSWSGHLVPLLLISATFLMEWLLAPVLEQHFALNINHTILGHLDTCALGIWFARKQNFQIPLPVMLIAGALFLWGNINPNIWVISGVCMLLFTLPILRYLSNRISAYRPIHALFFYLGNLSMYLFLCNGYLRHPLIDFAQTNPHWWTSLWTCFIFLAISVLWATGLRWMVHHAVPKNTAPT
jgi:peptidoglycan/LPS O-acetylase OafA/YrhL